MKSSRRPSPSPRRGGWGNRLALYAHLKAHLDPQTGVLQPAGAVLPDHAEWAEQHPEAAAEEHASGQFNSSAWLDAAEVELDSEKAQAIYKALQEALTQPTAKSRTRFYRLIASDQVIEYVDELLDSIMEHAEELDPVPLHTLACWLAREAPDRGAVKLGIALLGLFQEEPGDRELLLTLGAHDEFTLFCAVTLCNTLDEPAEALWQLAQRVQGWGRIQALECLPETDDPQIKDWLLREGFRNTVRDEYLAYLCAVRGDLLEALTPDMIDRDLLTSAGDLIGALLVGGPAEDIDDYEDAPEVLKRYLFHLLAEQANLREFCIVEAIREYVEDNTRDWDERESQGWTPETRSLLLESCYQLREKPYWPELARAGLQSPGEQEFQLAILTTQALDLPEAYEALQARLNADPLQPAFWHWVPRIWGADRVEAGLDWADTLLPVEALARWNADQAEEALDDPAVQCWLVLLLELPDYPGRGERLLVRALRSPLLSVRETALQAVARWPRGDWTQPLFAALTAAEAAEADPDLRTRLAAVLAGKPLPTSDLETDLNLPEMLFD